MVYVNKYQIFNINKHNRSKCLKYLKSNIKCKLLIKLILNICEKEITIGLQFNRGLKNTFKLSTCKLSSSLHNICLQGKLKLGKVFIPSNMKLGFL